MKYISIIILVMLLIPAVIAQSSLSSINATLISKGGVIANTERSWAESDISNGFITGHNQYNEGTTDMVFLTGPGQSRLDFSEETNHSLDNVLDSSLIASSEGGFVYGHGVYMGDQQTAVPDLECSAGAGMQPHGPAASAGNTTKTFVKGTNPSHQEVLIEKYGVGQGTYIESDIVAENANVTSSTRGEVYLGNLFEDIGTHAEAGFDKNETGLNYDKDERYHLGVYGNESGVGQSAIDFKWRDHSHPYGIGSDSGEVNTVNVTDSNLTNST